MSSICRWCGKSTDTPVVVGLEHVASAGGHKVIACHLCRLAHELLPLDQHPPGTDGLPRYENGEIIRQSSL